LNTDGTDFTVLRSFHDEDGVRPTGLTLAGNLLYGTTIRGGLINPSQPGSGTAFRMKTDGTGYQVLRSFTLSDGGYGIRAPTPTGVTFSGDALYGTLRQGGTIGGGSIFKMNPDGTGYTVLKDCTSSDGVWPGSGLVSSGGVLYGMTSSGGILNFGTVFKLKEDGTGYQMLKDFIANGEGAYPSGDLTCSDGVLYGTTSSGGSLNIGTVFRLNTDGTGYSVLKSFGGSPGDGAQPTTGLTLSGTVLYGTTTYGGSSNVGTVFRLNTDGTGYTVLKNFSFLGNDGYGPQGPLVISDKVIYGTTGGGGRLNYGTVFKVGTDGTGYKVLKDFFGSSDGKSPFGGLVLSGGMLFGSTWSGGKWGFGTVFKINTDGTGLTVLRHFNEADGFYPYGILTLSGGVLYGTRSDGGLQKFGTVFRMNTDGSGFSVLKHFGTQTAAFGGGHPGGILTLSRGALYGTTSFGGALGLGTVFRIDLPNLLTVQSTGNSIVLSWIDNFRTLQAAPAVNGNFTNVPGATSPFTNAITSEGQFFRLIAN